MKTLTKLFEEIAQEEIVSYGSGFSPTMVKKLIKAVEKYNKEVRDIKSYSDAYVDGDADEYDLIAKCLQEVSTKQKELL